MRVLKTNDGRHEIRYHDPKFDTDFIVSFEEDGAVTINIWQDAVDAIREIDEDEWFDSVQWTVPLAVLLQDFVSAFVVHGKLLPEKDDSDARRGIGALADRFDEAARMLRSVLTDMDSK